MTAPKPPETESFIQWGLKEAEAAALRVRNIHLSYHVAGVIAAALVAFGGYEAWKWHLTKLARLEAAASVEKTKATNEVKLANAWKTRALAKVDSFRVDTLKVKDLVFRVRVDTVLVHVVDSAGVQSEVPMAVVAKLDYDSLGAMCERTQHDCASALAAKDSVIVHDSAQFVALSALNANIASQLASVKRASLVSKIVWALAGVVVGRASTIR